MSATQQLEGPPAGQFPDDSRGFSDSRVSGGDRGGSRQRAFDAAVEAKAFYAMLEDPKLVSELGSMLPDTIDVKTFVRTAKTAVATNVDLLNPMYRPSLMQSIVKAASQGLLPDGKHGALVPRWDDRASRTQVCWQPMVWGITQLGRRAGALKKLTAHIVFEGEDYDLLGGEDDKITHRINPKIVDEVYAKCRTPEAFFDRVELAYCIITAPDGTQTWRYMTKSRIARVKASSKAGKGPWSGAFMDEMILKTVILFTAKHIDLDGDTPEMRRFREAMETDLEADFDSDGAQMISAPATRAALPAPGVSAMDRLEAQILGGVKQRETVSAGGGSDEQRVQQRPGAAGTSAAGESGVSDQKGDGSQVASRQDEKDDPHDAGLDAHLEDDERIWKEAKENADEAAKATAAAEQASQKFTDDAIAEIAAAAQKADGEQALAAVVGNMAIATRLGRLRAGYPMKYWTVVRSFLRPEVIGKIGLIQQANQQLFEDIEAKRAEAEEAGATEGQS
jgi:recombination protein RecT